MYFHSCFYIQVKSSKIFVLKIKNFGLKENRFQNYKLIKMGNLYVYLVDFSTQKYVKQKRKNCFELSLFTYYTVKLP